MRPIPYIYERDFMAKSVADDAFARLRDELAWVRRGQTPRMEYYVNRYPVAYTYGVGEFARTYEPMPTHPVIIAIQNALLLHTHIGFDVCFLNRYTDQSQHLGWHSDNSPEMDDTRPIAIVSLGVERLIYFREIDRPKRVVVNGNEQEDGLIPTPDVVGRLTLGHGSLCLMEPGMQDTHQHRIPKAGYHCGERISLTFRGYVQP